MYSKRATLGTINSLRILTKVCRAPSSSLFSDETLHLFRHFSTATERSHYLTTSNESNGENLVNPNGVPDNNYQNSNNVCFQDNQNGFYGQNPRNQYQQYGQNGKFSSGCIQNRQKNEVLDYSGGKNTTFNGYNGVNGNDAWQQNVYGYDKGGPVHFQQNGYGDYYAQSRVESSGSGSGQFGEGKQISGGNYGNSQQNWNGYYPQNAGMSQQSPYDYSPGRDGNFQYAQGNYYAGNPGMYQVDTGISNGYNASENQQNVNGSYQPAAGFYQQTTYQSPSGNAVTAGEGSGKLNESGQDSEGSQLRGSIEELDRFLQEGNLKEVVKVLGLLEAQRVSIDLSRYLMLIKACGENKALEEGKYVHDHLVRSGIHLELKSYNKILEMYCRCGSVDDAFKVFDEMPRRNLTSWDIMISLLAKNGHGEDAIELFTQFKEAGHKPDGKMFFGVFSACGVVGDTVEGLLHFASMSKDYGIVPSMEHYISVVDMLGSAGYLDEALEFIEKMPMEPHAEVWEVMMQLCRMHGNLELGDRCAEIVEALDSSRLDEQSRAGLIPVKPSDLAKDKEKKKLSGQSFPEGRSRVHEYRAGDRSHPEHEKLYALLRGMRQHMKEAGYMPEVKFVLHDIDQEGKEEALMAHSERLAVAQGLLTTPARYPIRIIKNLRICVDCHNAMKLISKLVGRELIIRDAKRFHHFRDGLCSCRDYW